MTKKRPGKGVAILPNTGVAYQPNDEARRQVIELVVKVIRLSPAAMPIFSGVQR